MLSAPPPHFATSLQRVRGVVHVVRHVGRQHPHRRGRQHALGGVVHIRGRVPGRHDNDQIRRSADGGDSEDDQKSYYKLLRRGGDGGDVS